MSAPCGMSSTLRSAAQSTKHSSRNPFAQQRSRKLPSRVTGLKMGSRSLRQRSAPPLNPDWRIGSVSHRYAASRPRIWAANSGGNASSGIGTLRSNRRSEPGASDLRASTAASRPVERVFSHSGPEQTKTARQRAPLAECDHRTRVGMPQLFHIPRDIRNF
jgi:hypothetical protein